MKRKLILALSLLIFVTTLFPIAACGGRGEDDRYQVDPNREQLYIAISDEGIGRDWLESDLIPRFEQAYPGYQVIPRVQNSELTDGTVQLLAPSSDIDIFYSQIEDLTTLEGVALDITDIVTEKVYDAQGEYVSEGGTQSISDKLEGFNSSHYGLFNMGTAGSEKFLALPYYTTPYGIWYDVDLFENEEYYSLGYEGITGTEDDDWGPDGEEGGFDDGLPATFEDFKLLITTLYSDGLTPLTWSGTHSWMRTHYLDTVWLNYEGVNDYDLNYTFSGTDSQFGTVSIADGWNLAGQEGRLAMLEMAHFLVSNTKFYSGDAFRSTQSHLVAQQDFLGSVTRSSRIAMIMDGSWWEYEAKGYMTSMASEKNEKYGYGKRRFGFMPVPAFIGTEGIEDQTNQETVLYDQNAMRNVFVNANTDVPEIAKAFLQFAHTNTSLSAFNRITGTMKPYVYTMSKSDYENLTYMGKQVYDMVHEDGVRLYYNVLSKSYSKYATYLSNWKYGTRIGDREYGGDPMFYFKENPSVTAEDYFNGMAVYYSQQTWEERVN